MRYYFANAGAYVGKCAQVHSFVSSFTGEHKLQERIESRGEPPHVNPYTYIIIQRQQFHLYSTQLFRGMGNCSNQYGRAQIKTESLH